MPIHHDNFMKSLLLALVALPGLTFLSGCVSEENGYYTPSQQYAQHADYDATDRVRSNVRY